MNFASDNVTGVAPEIFSALLDANDFAEMPYGADRQTDAVQRIFSDLFETDAGVLLVSTGTAANALALASATPRHGAIFCRQGAHIESNEGGAVEHLSGGARLIPLEGENGKIRCDELEKSLANFDPAARFARPCVVSITQASELGTVYSLQEISALAEVSHRHGMKLHVDGARWANAMARTGCSPAEGSWRCGVDILSFGATKNGALAAEAVVFFDRELMNGAVELRKRAGMLWAKHRYLSAQWHAYLKDDLWLRLAGRANAAADMLAHGLLKYTAAHPLYPVEANEVFVCLPEKVLDGLENAGFLFYRRGNGVIRLVTSFATTETEIADFLDQVQLLTRAPDQPR